MILAKKRLGQVLTFNFFNSFPDTDFQNTHHMYYGRVLLLHLVTGALYDSGEDHITLTTSVSEVQNLRI